MTHGRAASAPNTRPCGYLVRPSRSRSQHDFHRDRWEAKVAYRRGFELCPSQVNFHCPGLVAAALVSCSSLIDDLGSPAGRDRLACFLDVALLTAGPARFGAGPLPSWERCRAH